ncbi:selenocysteine lyase/cysteine desulfurase [Jatrophihabitans sp. GAS493]|uniref:aminotransferase class V-fold PLP-dependent enzyme n=1 Tax=Jatrophihabitans sp. GAS493 TaxID=1907575 RepID=UPI000BB6CCDC|nr:aminotransferase class V-fold PLP-dependent enzyme [Jatrophihabitans sp. GAS493]SOD74859.1 selenocysteine lyase/cysteine desulfurase [Jatrophihabitans sp. GAS493]
MTTLLDPTSHPAPTGADAEAALAALVGADQLVPLIDGPRVRYANLDYAASAPSLQVVADQVSAILPLYSSVHRGAGYASQVCTAAYEAARSTVADFVGAREGDVVIFTRNTTDALNLLASAIPETPTSAVVYLDIEHHANLLPWQARDGRVVPARETLAQTVAALEVELARSPAALLAVTGASNVTGELLPLAELADLAHRYGARIAVDGAQLVPHRRVDIEAAGIDYLAFSGHKIYAPFGAGVLVGRRDWLDAAAPHLAGGGAVRSVSLEATVWTDAPARHEAGTPNVVGAVALAAACRAVRELPADAVERHEEALLRRLDEGLAAVGAVPLRLWAAETERIAVVTFVLPGFTAELVAQYLSAEHGIGVRDGKFCAHPLLTRFNATDGAVRASVGLGSRLADIDRLISALAQLRADGPAWTYERINGYLAPSPDPRELPSWLEPDDAGGPASPCVTG